MKKIIQCLEQLNSLEGSLFIYSLSFSLLLAIAPSITVFVTSFEWFNIDVSQITAFASKYFPSEYVLPFVEFLTNNSPASRLTSLISMVVSLYLASRCLYSFLLISASNEKIDYPKWSLRIYSVFEFVVIYIYLMFSILLATFIYVPIVYVGAALFGFYFFYHLCTFKKRGFKYGMIGSLFSSVSIFLVGTLFFKIVQTFTNYDSIYGPLASFMILLLSVFVISSIIYMGYILNNLFIENKENSNRKNIFFHLCQKIEDRIFHRIRRKKV